MHLIIRTLFSTQTHLYLQVLPAAPQPAHSKEGSSDQLVHWPEAIDQPGLSSQGNILASNPQG